jgi:O-antigen/teichoic acid export membrane protein
MTIPVSSETPESALAIPRGDVANCDAAPARPHRSIIYLVGSLATGNVIASVLAAIGGILQAKIAGPDVMGVFLAATLVLGYIPFLQLAIPNGLNRELPYFIGKGEHHRVRELAAAAQAWALLTSVWVIAVMLLVAGWYLLRGDLWRTTAWICNGFLAFYAFYCTYYLQTTYRTGHDFAKLALALVVQNAVGLAMIVLVAMLSFYGVCLRAILSNVAGLALLYYWRPLRIGPKWNARHLKHLLIIGAPIFAVGMLYAWWTTLNATFVLGYTGEHGAGLYGMATTALTMLAMLPLAVGQVVYPRMSEQFGRTGRGRDLMKFVHKPIALTVLGMIAIVVILWPLVPPVMRLVLPDYIEAVPAVQWSLLVPITMSLIPATLVFNVVRRQELYAVALVLGMAVYVGCLLWFVRNGAELVMFPQALAIGQAVFYAVAYVLAIAVTRKEPSTA